MAPKKYIILQSRFIFSPNNQLAVGEKACERCYGDTWNFVLNFPFFNSAPAL